MKTVNLIPAMTADKLSLCVVYTAGNVPLYELRAQEGILHTITDYQEAIRTYVWYVVNRSGAKTTKARRAVQAATHRAIRKCLPPFVQAQYKAAMAEQYSR